MNHFESAMTSFARTSLAHVPTPIELMPNLSEALGSASVYIKRDDCTGLAMGGNKARQLEFYLGDALARDADTILITGAVQSNYVRMAAAAARKCGLQCHIQLEERVSDMPTDYYTSGNVLLDRLLGATIHNYPVGEDEQGADDNLEVIADELRSQGGNPYVIHLGAGHPPLGALGYARAAQELAGQLTALPTEVTRIVVPSGSSFTHTGLLFGLRALGVHTPVSGICVRRGADLQKPRVLDCAERIAALLGISNPVTADDVIVHDDVLAPGYGKLNDGVREALKLAAEKEGLFVDPVYTGKALAGLISLVRSGQIAADETCLFLHTGGTPALFGYVSTLVPASAQ